MAVFDCKHHNQQCKSSQQLNQPEPHQTSFKNVIALDNQLMTRPGNERTWVRKQNSQLASKFFAGGSFESTDFSQFNNS